MDWGDAGERVLNLYSLGNPPVAKTLQTFARTDGHVAFPRFFKDAVVFVHDFRSICVLSGDDGVRQLGQHRADIVILEVVRLYKFSNPPKPAQARRREEVPEDTTDLTVIISVDMAGSVCVWHEERLAEVLEIAQMPELSREYREMRYFAMGYPYMLAACGGNIALSTAIAVLVIGSKFLERLTQN